jgi:hypothetical protein
MENSVNGIIERAKTASVEDLSITIERVISLLSKEQKNRRKMGAHGRLFRLQPQGTAIIVGDLHGDLESLARIIEDSNFMNAIPKDGGMHLIFLGDYGDRGSASPEVYYTVLKLKELYPERVVLMRGNHEGPDDMIPFPYDLPHQFQRKYGRKDGEKTLIQLRKLFSRFYSAVMIEGQAVLIHGGVPSTAKSIKDLAHAHKTHPREPLLKDMLWSDPQESRGIQPSPRGIGNLFGPDVTREFLRLLNVKVLIRGHECCPEGSRIDHDNRVLTLFSTNKRPYTNGHGAYLQYDLSTKIQDARDLILCIRQFE